MKISTLISHTAELLKIIYKSPQPADKVTSQYLRKKKYIGSKERKFISELLFHTLRNYYLLQHLASTIEKKSDYKTEKDLILNIYAIVSGLIFYKEINEIQENNLLFNHFLPYTKIFKDEQDFLEYILAEFEISASSADLLATLYDEFEILNNIGTDSNDKLKIRYSINDTFLKSIDKYLSGDMKINLLKSLCKSAPLTIRINSSQIELKKVMDFFNENSIEITKTKYSPAGITINNRINLNDNPLYKNGLIDIQDEGSQLISYALNPESHKRILDACAGAGGKSLHIADICNDNAEIIASDIDNRKLNELLRRAKKSKFKSIKTVHIHHKLNLDKHPNFMKKFDFVLVDAPCSGTGTTRRMPLPKYRINNGLIKRLQSNQLKILNRYSKFVKAGGILVYSTCSLLFEENQEVVNIFLEENDNFQPEPLKPSLDKFNIHLPELNENDFYINLLPSIHNTDVFFIAKFRRSDR